MFWLWQNWACEAVCHTVRKKAQKEDSGRGTYKIGYEEVEPDTNEDEEVEWISGSIHVLHKGKEKPMMTTLTIPRKVTQDGNKHGSEHQYCEKTHMVVSLEER